MLRNSSKHPFFTLKNAKLLPIFLLCLKKYFIEFLSGRFFSAMFFCKTNISDDGKQKSSKKMFLPQQPFSSYPPHARIVQHQHMQLHTMHNQFSNQFYRNLIFFSFLLSCIALLREHQYYHSSNITV